MAEPTTELTTALQRADKLIKWMSGYIGKMAPGDYANCYRDLNEHGMFMDRLNRIDTSDERRLQIEHHLRGLAAFMGPAVAANVEESVQGGSYGIALAFMVIRSGNLHL